MKKEKAERLDIQEEVTEKKPGLASRIISIVLMVIFAGIAILVIFASFLPKNFNPNLNDPTFIKIYQSDTQSASYGTVYGENTEEYKKIMELYNDSFKTTLMSALFQNKLGEKVTVKEGYKSLSSLSGTYIEFFYNESQNIMLDGQEYKAEIVSNTSYIRVVIEVLDTTDFSQINVYFKYRDTGANNYSYVRFLTYARQAELYDYIEKL